MQQDQAAPEAQAHRQRLLEGMAKSVGMKGYPASTVADIVAQAGVSRRTFYEHFDSRADCLIALYEAAGHGAIGVLRSALDPSRDWQTQVELALKAYLEFLASDPVLMRTLYIEILGLGLAGLAARRRVNQEIAGFMLAVINTPLQAALLTPELAMSVVGGVNELILVAIEQDRIAHLPHIAVTAAALIRAVIVSPGAAVPAVV